MRGKFNWFFIIKTLLNKKATTKQDVGSSRGISRVFLDAIEKPLPLPVRLTTEQSAVKAVIEVKDATQLRGWGNKAWKKFRLLGIRTLNSAIYNGASL